MTTPAIDTRDNYYHGRLCTKHSNRLRYTANRRCIYCSPRHPGAPILSQDEYAAKLAEQDGGCAVCHEKPLSDERKLDVDKTTGKLLCRSCIVGFEMFNHDPKLLRATAAYLERHQEALPPSLLERHSTTE